MTLDCLGGSDPRMSNVSIVAGGPQRNGGSGMYVDIQKDIYHGGWAHGRHSREVPPSAACKLEAQEGWAG